MPPYDALFFGVATFLGTLSRVHAFAATDSQSSSSSTSCRNLLDISALKDAIGSGRVYQHHDFLSKEEVDQLWVEIRHLEESGAFARSGLSNTVHGSNQQFGAQDRTLCPVQWWADSLLGKDATASSSVINIQPIASRIQDLRVSLAGILDRPTMTDANLSHECYYSISKIGSFLPRHMDERHEELKGAKGWLLPSRRSLSWLIYLSDPEDWSLQEHGGALRSFSPRSIVPGAQLTQDQGNLQIGWLLQEDDYQEPVFMDSWVPVMDPASPEQLPEPHCILYTRNTQANERVFLTRPWLTESLQGISIPEFLKNSAQKQSSGSDKDAESGLFLRKEYANKFALIEDRPAWDRGFLPDGTIAHDIAPIRGSLVVFDSVAVPHQVELIKKGKRVALAGWFHEATQPIPDYLYS